MGKGRPNRREKMMEEVAINSKWLPQVQPTWRKNCLWDAFYFRARRFCTVIPYVLQNLAKAEALTFDSVAKYHYKWRATGSLSKDKCFADLDWGDVRLRDLTVQNRFAFSRSRQSNKAPPYPASILFFTLPSQAPCFPDTLRKTSSISRASSWLPTSSSGTSKLPVGSTRPSLGILSTSI